MGVMGALLVWTIAREELNLDAVSVFLSMGILSVCALLVLNSTLQLNENGITYRGLRGASVLKWSEITDVHSSPHVLSITAAHRRTKIVLQRGEYAGIGIGYEPFEELCQEVTHHTLPRLSQIWAQQGLPLVCRYPGITRQIVLAYAIPILLIMTFFMLFVVMTEGMLIQKVLFLFVGLLPIVPFWLRDYRKNCSTLIVTSDGIKQTNGHDVMLAWPDVQEILLTEQALGIGWIIVKGRGGIEIQIPRTLRKCGAILYWLKRYTNLTETSQPVMTEKW
jgi:hypothetical protein